MKHWDVMLTLTIFTNNFHMQLQQAMFSRLIRFDLTQGA
jgi:hypothetical protein